jgi:hypothetical protein
MDVARGGVVGGERDVGAIALAAAVEAARAQAGDRARGVGRGHAGLDHRARGDARPFEELDRAHVDEAADEQPRYRLAHRRDVERRAEQAAGLGDDRQAIARGLGLVDELLHADAGDDQPLVDPASLVGELATALDFAGLVGAVARLDHEPPCPVAVIERRPHAQREDAPPAARVEALEARCLPRRARRVHVVEQRGAGLGRQLGEDVGERAMHRRSRVVSAEQLEEGRVRAHHDVQRAFRDEQRSGRSLAEAAERAESD